VRLTKVRISERPWGRVLSGMRLLGARTENELTLAASRQDAAWTETMEGAELQVVHNDDARRDRIMRQALAQAVQRATERKKPKRYKFSGCASLGEWYVLYAGRDGHRCALEEGTGGVHGEVQARRVYVYGRRLGELACSAASRLRSMVLRILAACGWADEALAQRRRHRRTRRTSKHQPRGHP